MKQGVDTEFVRSFILEGKIWNQYLEMHPVWKIFLRRHVYNTFKCWCEWFYETDYINEQEANFKGQNLEEFQSNTSEICNKHKMDELIWEQIMLSIKCRESNLDITATDGQFGVYVMNIKVSGLCVAQRKLLLMKSLKTDEH